MAYKQLKDFLLRLMKATMNLIIYQNHSLFLMAGKQYFPSTHVYNQSIRQNLILTARSETESRLVLVKNKKERKVKVRGPSFSLGRWCKREVVEYVRFLEKYYQQFISGGQSRRLKKTFVRMADKIGSRDPDQCRSHHQKMMAFRSSVLDIIQFFKLKYPDEFSGQVKIEQEINILPAKEYFPPAEKDQKKEIKVTVVKNHIRIELWESQIKSYYL